MSRENDDIQLEDEWDDVWGSDERDDWGSDESGDWDDEDDDWGSDERDDWDDEDDAQSDVEDSTQPEDTVSEQETEDTEDTEDVIYTEKRVLTVGNESEHSAVEITENLNLDSTAFSLKHKVIATYSIAVTQPIKKGRSETFLGLSESIKQLGVLTPIHVTPTEEYLEWLENHSEEDAYPHGDRYILLHGYRRLFAALKNNIDTIPAIVVNFRDRESANDLLLAFSLVLGKSEKRSWAEKYSLMGVLEMLHTISPMTLEYLLNMNSGESVKLRDIMTAGYEEVVEDLLGKDKPIDSCYNKLNKLRKDENRLLNEDKQGIADIEDAEEIAGDSTGGKKQLTNEEVAAILEVGESGGLDDNSFGGADIFGEAEAEVQDTKNRHPLDPALRASVLRRDDYTCQACLFGQGVPSTIQLAALEVHHMIPVMLGGPDSMDNLVVLCSTCHKTAHVIANAGGKIGISREDFLKLTEHSQNMWNKLGKLSNIILSAEKKTGKSFKKHNVHKLPENKPFWELQKENEAALKSN